MAGEGLFGALSSQLHTTDEDSILAVIRTLEALDVSPQEVEYYVKNRDWLGYRVLIFDGGHFNAVLNIWEPQQESVVHDHVDSHAWMRVLEGSLVDLEYAFPSDTLPGRVVRCVTVQRGSVSYSAPSIVHALRNASASGLAASLHVYSPPCTACRWHSVGINVKRSTTKISSITTRAKVRNEAPFAAENKVEKISM
jgi:cysteine dioxygenase